MTWRVPAGADDCINFWFWENYREIVRIDQYVLFVQLVFFLNFGDEIVHVYVEEKWGNWGSLVDTIFRAGLKGRERDLNPFVEGSEVFDFPCGEYSFTF